MHKILLAILLIFSTNVSAENIPIAGRVVGTFRCETEDLFCFSEFNRLNLALNSHNYSCAYAGITGTCDRVVDVEYGMIETPDGEIGYAQHFRTWDDPFDQQPTGYPVDRPRLIHKK